jgi:hypothetical protein
MNQNRGKRVNRSGLSYYNTRADDEEVPQFTNTLDNSNSSL